MFNGKSINPKNNHQMFMRQALSLAETAYDNGEVPVGAVVVYKNKVIGKGYNQTEMLNDPTAHAEMIAISSACATLENKYLIDCTLYVTLEPCPMCAGAIVWSKLSKLFYAAIDVKAGSCGSVFNIAANNKLNHKVEVYQGVFELESEKLLKQFFSDKRT